MIISLLNNISPLKADDAPCFLWVISLGSSFLLVHPPSPLQNFSWWRSGQETPPLLSGLVTVLLLVDVPDPHEELHSVQADQADTSQSNTGEIYHLIICIMFILIMYQVYSNVSCFFIMHHVYHNYYVLCIILLLRIMCILIILAHYTDTLLLLLNIKLMVEIYTAILNRKQNVRQIFYWNNKHWNKTLD